MCQVKGEAINPVQNHESGSASDFHGAEGTGVIAEDIQVRHDLVVSPLLVEQQGSDNCH